MKTQTPTKIFLTACAIAASLIGFGASSRADNYIGASFMGRNINGTVNAGEVAGAPGFQQKNWNNIDDNAVGFNGTTGGLKDRNGAATPVTLQFAANDSWNDDGPQGTANERLMAGVIKAAGAGHVDNFAFHNVPPGTYTMAVYTDVNGDGVQVDIAAGGTIYQYVENHQF